MIDYRRLRRHEFKRLCRILYGSRNYYKFRIITDSRYRTVAVFDKRGATKIFINPEKYPEAVIRKGYTFKSYNGKSTKGFIKIGLPQTLISYLIAKNNIISHIKMTPREISMARSGLDKEFKEFDWSKFRLIGDYENPSIKKFIIEGYPYLVEDIQGVGFKLFDSQEVERGKVNAV